MWDRKLAGCIDHTDLRANACERDIVRLCEEAKRFGFKAAVVAPCYVNLASVELSGSDVRLCSVVSFPLGSHTPAMKAGEAEELMESGVHELDMVMNIGAFLSKRYRTVEDEIRWIAEICRDGSALLKVIIETAYLNSQEIKTATELIAECGADFVKTSTGFASPGATVDAVRSMKDAAGERLQIKAAGGIRTREAALRLILAGASRLGCSTSIDVVALEDREE
jgi:deoxyribose-phosphate aldolase